MVKRCSQIVLTLFFSLMLVADSGIRAQNPPVIEWQKSFGGTIGETANSVLQLPDGHFVFAGYTRSKDGDVTGSMGATDFWVVKLNAEGGIIWQRVLGGSDHDAQWDLQMTSDGGFLVSGQSKSSNGDVLVNKGLEDYWLIRLDASGNIIWQKTYGGSAMDEAYSAIETVDGGFVVAGYSESNDGDVSGNHGEVDYWVIRLDVAGNLIWQRSLGGSGEDEAYYVQQTSDGGFVVVGESESTDGDVTGNHGEGDFWVVKLNASGYVIWQKSYGGSSVDYARSVKQTATDELIIAGWSSSNNGDVTGNKGDTDYWVIKLDANGEMIWQKCYGGSDYDFAYAVDPTADGGFIVTGYTHSSDGDVTGHHGSTDYWLVKLDSDGNLQWQKTLGGSQYDQSYSVKQTLDGGYIIAGLSFSDDGDVTGNHHTAIGTTQDCWIVKLGNDLTGIEPVTTNLLRMYPNPVQSTVFLVIEDLQITGFDKHNPDQFELRICDMKGKSIELPWHVAGEEIILNTSAVAPGCYLLQVFCKQSGNMLMGNFIRQ